METIASINSAINNFVWGIPAMVCILGIGLYLSIRTGFIQVRKFGLAMKETFGKIFSKDATAEGAISPFQALCTALAATVGTGNIAGVAGAIAIGGPGAVFWMWISAILGMCTKFSEVTLAVHFREIDDTGTYVGGPMYYIRNGLGKNFKWLGVIFATFGILAVFGTGNATQVNTITTSINTDEIVSTVMKNVSGMTSQMMTQISDGIQKAMGMVVERLAANMTNALKETFEDFGSALTIDQDAFAAAFKLNMGENELQSFMNEMMGSDISSAEGNLHDFGYCDKDDLQSIIDDGQGAELGCHFCRKTYFFTTEELKALIGGTTHV